MGDIFGDCFGSFTGGSSQRRNAPTKGQNITAAVEITFEEAAFGTEKEVNVSTKETALEPAEQNQQNEETEKTANEEIDDEAWADITSRMSF